MVAKASPEEKVGVFARRGAHVEVVEYSEMDPEEAASKDAGTQPIPQLTLLKCLACTSCHSRPSRSRGFSSRHSTAMNLYVASVARLEAAVAA